MMLCRSVPAVRRFLKKDIPLNACLKTDGCRFFNHEIHETHEKIQKIRECSVLTIFVFSWLKKQTGCGPRPANIQ